MSRRDTFELSRLQSRRRHDTFLLLLTSEVRVAMSLTTSEVVARARAEHPSICRVCRGCGFEPGEPITVQLDGRLIDESTLRPCEHKWWWDDPTPDEPISLGEYRDRLARRAAAGDVEAADELELWARWLSRLVLR
jgi:hypothetical protein